MSAEESLNPSDSAGKIVLDENLAITNTERLPISSSLKVLRYRTIKKNDSLGWWSVIVLLEDHNKKQVSFYRWRKRGKEWKRDKKISFRTRADWAAFKESIDGFISELE